MSLSLFDLSGSVALVTGSSRGLGLMLARGLAEAGAKVILNARDSAALAAAQAEFRSAGLDVEIACFDVTSEAAVAEGLNRVTAEAGPIDILVNNAGINRRGPLTELSEEDWSAVININLSGPWRIARHVARGMLERRRGKIINIASLMSFGGRENTGVYTASKGGLAALTRAMAVEWGPANVQVNAIAPGYFLSEMTAPLAANPEFDAWVRMRSPSGRWGDPRELVGAAIFLASSASNYVNGQVLYVDGGWTAKL